MVRAGEILIADAPSTILVNLTVAFSSTFLLDSNVTVNGFVQIDGDVRGNGTLFSPTVTLGSTSTFVFVLSTLPSSTKITFLVISSPSITGQFSRFSAIYTGPDSGCYTLDSAPLQSASGLSATVGVTNRCSGGLSTGAIVGIVIGATLAALAAVVLLVWLMRRHRKKRTAEMQADLRKKALSTDS